MIQLQLVRFEDRDLPSTVLDTPVLPLIDDATRLTIQAVHAHGRDLSNRDNVFMNVGDSLTVDPLSVAALGSSEFSGARLGNANPDLVDTWAVYLSRIPGGNSYTRDSLAAAGGMTTLTALAGVQAEIDSIRPSVAIIGIGTNDSAAYHSTEFSSSYRSIVETCIRSGVIPILVTLPDITLYGPFSDARSYAALHNQIILDFAVAYHLPVLNLRSGLEPLANFGLRDGIHLTEAGNEVRNLGVLGALKAVRDVLIGESSDPPASPWTPLEPGRRYVAVTTATSDVLSILAANGSVENLMTAPGYGSEATVADVTGDGTPDVAVGAGDGSGSWIRVHDGRDGATVASFSAFEPTFRGGVHLAAGDVDGDDIADLIVGAGDGGAPVVRVFRGGDFTARHSYFAFESTFRGGVNVAAANVDGDGGEEVIAGAAPGGAPLVKVFGSGGESRGAFFAFESTARGGVNVSGGDIDGDGRDEIFAGPGAGGPRVEVFDGVGRSRQTFFADGFEQNSGARAVLVDLVLWVETGRGDRLRRFTMPGSVAMEDVILVDPGTRVVAG